MAKALYYCGIHDKAIYRTNIKDCYEHLWALMKYIEMEKRNND